MKIIQSHFWWLGFGSGHLFKWQNDTFRFISVNYGWTEFRWCIGLCVAIGWVSQTLSAPRLVHRVLWWRGAHVVGYKADISADTSHWKWQLYEFNLDRFSLITWQHTSEMWQLLPLVIDEQHILQTYHAVTSRVTGCRVSICKLFVICSFSLHINTRNISVTHTQILITHFIPSHIQSTVPANRDLTKRHASLIASTDDRILLLQT